MASTLKSRLEHLEQQHGAAGEPLIVRIACFAPFEGGDGIFVEGQFFAEPAGTSLEELERKTIGDLVRSSQRRLIVVKHYQSLE